MDLHLHTTFSDGAYSPGEIVDLARRSGLSAIAVTDHDTLAGIAPTRHAAGDALEIVAGVEITTGFLGREVHLLAYFFDADDVALGLALDHLRAERVGRFHEMIARLRGQGVPIEEAAIARLSNSTTLGRPHVAALIVQARKAGSVREAFQRYLHDQGKAAVPKTRLPVAEAIALVRQAGGVASWAHPNYHCTREALVELKRLGLSAVEVEYPAFQARRRKELRQLAAEVGLTITGGSDCHGPGQPHRAVGASSITHDELERLRARTQARG
ncbi:MAG: PHP domain-containing protein [Planctomycetes bacterium]|nr:PHP domain-containing protein [Planctomycetota bacterium]